MRVDFYILPNANTQQRRHFACRLAEKAWQQNNRIYIQTDSASDSQMLDQMLWTFNDNSFIPHGIAGSESDAEQAILIGHENCMQAFDLLINLSAQLPTVQHCKRIAEIIHQDDATKLRGREHYKHYREQQCELHHHEINEP